MSAMFACEDPAVWRELYGKYWEVLEAKSLRKKGKNSGKLLELDKWYQEALPAAIASRPDRYVARSELIKIMDWKLTRGKFRPRLQELVATNSKHAVEGCSRMAFSLLPDTQAAIVALCNLKALGPAMASAVLAAGAPDQVAFMADEAMESVPGLRLQYTHTTKHYALYLDKMVERTKTLNEVDSQRDWTPHRVELCLWTWTVANQLKIPLHLSVDVTGNGVHDDKDDEDSDQKPCKKRRTK